MMEKGCLKRNTNGHFENEDLVSDLKKEILSKEIKGID